MFICEFLKLFYYDTLRFFGSNYVTSNKFLDQISFIQIQLDVWSDNMDYRLGFMVDSMKKKRKKSIGNNGRLESFVVYSCFA